MAAAWDRAARHLAAGASALLLAVLVCVAPAPAAAAQGDISTRLQGQLQAVIDAARTAVPVPGISAAVATPEDVWTGVAGLADLGPKVPMTADTPFSIGSVTKTFVAAVVLQLVQEGKLRLSDHLSRWETHVPYARRITVRELLNHTSGVRDMWRNVHYTARVEGRPSHVWTYAEVRAMIGPARFLPGTRWEYSNSNYVLLGHIVQRITGHSVAREIRKRLLGPLHLDSTWYQGAEVAPRTPAMGYLRKNHRWVPQGDGTGLRPTTSIATFFGAAGAMMSTPRDLATWARALYGGHVLSAASLRLMTTFNGHDYGLGARRYDDVGGRVAWGHGGSLDGFETTMWYLPSMDSAVIVMWNSREVDTDPTAGKLARRLINALDPDTTPPSLGKPAITLRTGASVTPGHAPVVVWWPAARDSQSLIQRYQVRSRTGTGAWRAVSLASRLSRSVGLSIATGRTTTVEVRAVDTLGNVGPWVRATPVVARFIDDDAAAVQRGTGWYRKPERDALGGTVLASTQSRSRLGLDIPALALALVAPRSRVMGQASVRIDGADALTLRLRATRRTARAVVLTRRWAHSGNHRIRVSVRATSHPRVEVDGFLVLQAH